MEGFQKGNAKYLYSFQNIEKMREWVKKHKQAVGLAFVGRSNAGKSTLINSFFGKKVARTSKTPGRTQAINIFETQVDDITFYIYDLPGYGHAQVSKDQRKHWDKLIHSFFQACGQNTLIMNIQDSRHPMQKADTDFYNYLAQFPLDTFLLFNKVDKLKKQKDRAVLNKMKPTIFKEHKWVKQIHFISAERKDGLEQLENSLISYIMERGVPAPTQEQ